MRYQPTGLRCSLEDRLKHLSRTTAVLLDRLRKEASMQRLLARLAVAAPEREWALKGGLLMIAKMGSRARGTSDADITWRVTVDELFEALDAAADLDLEDHFAYHLDEPRRLQAEGPEGGLRFRMLSRLAGVEFERIRLDINLLPGDGRPVERVPLRNLFEFAELETVVVPAITTAQQLAEKLHAYVRTYTNGPNDRAKDLFDMLAIAEHLELPPLRELQSVCREVFAFRDTPWPLRLPPPPHEWESQWRTLALNHGVPYTDLGKAFVALSRFWEPILTWTTDGKWSPEPWRWTT